jgi:hypothetical protein
MKFQEVWHFVSQTPANENNNKPNQKGCVIMRFMFRLSVLLLIFNFSSNESSSDTKVEDKYPLYRVILWRHSYVKRVFPDSVIQNIVKIFVRNSHDFVEWTQAIQSEYETLINHNASKAKNSIWVKNNLQ